jgi:hypothetical protein
MHKICKRLKLPVPEGCYSDSEMREALLGFHFRKVDKLTVATFTDQFGPSKASLFRQYSRLVDALKLAGVAEGSSREQVRNIIASMPFETRGRPALFLPDEESLLLETRVQISEHGGPGSKRLQLNHAKRMAADMASDPSMREAERVRLGSAKLHRSWLKDARAREAVRNGGVDPFVDKKPALLSQKRAAAKRPGRNAQRGNVCADPGQV